MQNSTFLLLSSWTATHFGIALPKWIVERENSVWVLAVYGLVFMVILPVVVVCKKNYIASFIAEEDIGLGWIKNRMKLLRRYSLEFI